MHHRFALLASAFILLLLPHRVVADAGSRSVENLRAFTRVYGYVRFFHPSDEALAVNWDSMGILGAERCRDARDLAELRTALLAVFQPIAPSMQLSLAANDAGKTSGSNDLVGEKESPLTFWQYQGINLLGKEKEGVYRQRRVIIGDERFTGPPPLFQPVAPSASIDEMITPGIVLSLPLVLPVDDHRKTRTGDQQAVERLRSQLAAVDPGALTAEDWRVRVADVAVVWNVFQHFHPYLKRMPVDWNGALESALNRALSDSTPEEYYATLSELVARTGDGHGYVYGKPPGAGGIPIRVAVVEGRVVVTGVAGDAAFRKGDVIERVDGADSLEVLLNRERYVAGSPQLRRFRALNQFGEGKVGSVAKIEILRDGATVEVEYVRQREKRGYFFNSVREFEYPALEEIRPGIFYVNLMAVESSALKEALPRLAQAKGVIFDERWDGRKTGSDEKRVKVHVDIIPHLIGEPIQASPMLTPQITKPDHVDWAYEESTWPVHPREPRIKGKVVFINEPSVVSYGETCMAMIAHYRLAALVGDSTAGCNGNVNFIPLPGGFRVMWTGMDVRTHDHSSFYGIGFAPDFPVNRTLEAVRNGIDDYLDKAIEVIEQSSAATVPTPAVL